MTEHQKETAFLRHCILYDDGAERHRLEERIMRGQRDERCLRRAMWLMVLLVALAVAGLGYGMVLEESVLDNTSPLILTIICAVGVGSLFCLLVFVGIGIAYRNNLDQRRQECRQLVTRLLESRLGQPVATPLRDLRVGNANDEPVQVVTEANGSLGTAESIVRG